MSVLVFFALLTLTSVQVIVPGSASDVLLKQNIIPKFYQIKLYPDLEAGTFRGHVSIDLDVNDYYSSLTLHGKNLVIEKTFLKRLSGISGETPEEVEIKNTTVNDNAGTLTIYLANYAQVYIGSYNLEIIYEGKVLENMAGFYRSSYNYGGEKRWLGATQFEPIHARRAFPCFDEPHFRTGFTLDVEVPDSYAVISNVNATQNKVNTFTNYHFENYPKMPTYLLAWVIYEKYTFGSTDSYTINGTEYRTWARQDYLPLAKFANQVQSKLLNALANKFGVPYKLNKMDQVAVPDFSAGAMENWGLVTYREAKILYDGNVSTTEDFRDTAMVIAHEFTHQWFGNLVTLDFWSYTWLNEAFARFFQYFLTAEVFPDWKLPDMFVVLAQQQALFQDTSSQHPLTCEIKNESEISDMFDPITYNKGASIVRMMKHLLTPTNFEIGLTRYLKSIGDSKQVAKPNDLFKILTSVSPPGLKYNFETVMRSWTDQSGYPLVTVHRNPNNTLTVTQKRFRYEEDTANVTYYIPLTYTNGKEANFTSGSIQEWLEQDKTEKLINTTFCPKTWFIFNIEQLGFYRVNYDTENWNKLIKQLKEDHEKIVSTNRAQLIDDAFMLSNRGLLNYSTVLDLTTYLANEEQFTPWVPAINGFNYLLDMYYHTEDLYKSLKVYLLKLTQPAVKSIGFKQSEGEKLAQKIKRRFILQAIGKLGHPDALSVSKLIISDLVNGGRPRFAPDVQKALLCAGLTDENATKEWNSIYNVYQSSQYPTQKLLLLSALACTKNRQLLNRLINDTLTDNPKIRRQDSSKLFTKIASTPHGADFMIDYVINNHQKLIKYNFNKTNLIGSIISDVSDRVYDNKTVVNITAFNEKYKEELGNETYTRINKTLKIINCKLDWRVKHKQEILTWLINEEKTTTTTTTEKSTVTTIIVPTTKKSDATHVTSSVFIVLTTLLVVTYNFC